VYLLQIVADNRISDVKKVLSQQQVDRKTVERLLNEDDKFLCHANCSCKKCRRLRNMVANKDQFPSLPSQDCVLKTNGHILSETIVPEIRDHFPSQRCSDVDIASSKSAAQSVVKSEKTKTQSPPKSFLYAAENSGYIAPSTSRTVNDTSGEIPQQENDMDCVTHEVNNENKGQIPIASCLSAAEMSGNMDCVTHEVNNENKGQISIASCLSAAEMSGNMDCVTHEVNNENKGQIPIASCLSAAEMSGNVPLSTCRIVDETCGQTTLQTHELSIGNKDQSPLSETSDISCSDTKGRLPTPASGGGLRCHPLCCCYRCSQVAGCAVVEVSPDVYCRNERGFSGLIFNLLFLKLL